MGSRTPLRRAPRFAIASAASPSSEACYRTGPGESSGSDMVVDGDDSTAAPQATSGGGGGGSEGGKDADEEEELLSEALGLLKLVGWIRAIA